MVAVLGLMAAPPLTPTCTKAHSHCGNHIIFILQGARGQPRQEATHVCSPGPHGFNRLRRDGGIYRVDHHDRLQVPDLPVALRSSSRAERDLLCQPPRDLLSTYLSGSRLGCSRLLERFSVNLRSRGRRDLICSD